MQSAKAQTRYKVNHFDVNLIALSQKKLSLMVTDPFQKIQFEDKELTLTNIGTSTLMKAFQQNKIQIKLDMQVNKTAENTFLKIQILVSSQFLKPVEETILLKKKRDISEAEILTKAVQQLGFKMKKIKQRNQPSPNATFCNNPMVQQKLYNYSSNYQAIGSVKLSKGKYLITVSFLLKATSQWIYIYLNQGQTFMSNSGFYVPTTSYFMPHTLRKVHSVNNNEEVVNINTYYASSYPVTLRNVVVTAKRLD